MAWMPHRYQPMELRARDIAVFSHSCASESLFFENAFSNVGRTHGSLVDTAHGPAAVLRHMSLFHRRSLQGDAAYRHLLDAAERKWAIRRLQLGHASLCRRGRRQPCSASTLRTTDGRISIASSAPPGDDIDVFRRAVAERLDERIGYLFGLRHAIDAYAQVEGRRESPYWRDERRVDTLIRLSADRGGALVRARALAGHALLLVPSVGNRFSGPDRCATMRSTASWRRPTTTRGMSSSSLRASGRLDRTIVVVTSDHTNGWTTKGRVPLMIRFPGGTSPGRYRPTSSSRTLHPRC